MDINCTIIGIIILAAFIVPFILLHIKKSNEKKTFSDFCNENDITVSEKETVNHYTIAIDREHRKFVRAEIKGGSINSVIIDIEPGCKCEVEGDETSGVSLKIGSKKVTLTSDDDGIQTNKEALHTAEVWIKKMNEMK